MSVNISNFFKKFELLNIAHYSPNIEKIDKLLGNILLMVVSLLFLTLSAKLFWLKSLSSKIGDFGLKLLGRGTILPEKPNSITDNNWRQSSISLCVRRTLSLRSPYRCFQGEIRRYIGRAVFQKDAACWEGKNCNHEFNIDFPGSVKGQKCHGCLGQIISISRQLY